MQASRTIAAVACADRLNPPGAVPMGDAAAMPAGVAWADDPDTALMLAFCAGDDSAFEQLVQRNQQNVHNLAWRILGGQDVEDVVQDVFLRVYRARGQYSASAKFTTWLYRVTANTALNARRKRGNHPNFSMDALEHPADPADADHGPPPAGVDLQELGQVAWSAMQELPEQQRVALTLCRFESLSYEQIAELMGCSTAAVKSLISRARQNLKRALQGYLSGRGGQGDRSVGPA